MIKISHANKYFNRNSSNEIHVINDISIDLPRSGMIAIFGRSGCGKTTLLNCIGGLDTIASGSINIDGNELTASTDRIRNKYIGYIFQNYNLNNSKTCFENVADALYLCGMNDPEEIEKRVMTALKNVDMDKYKKRTPDTLSGGQQQRIAIARAIVKNPSIILADEPTGNLDEENTVRVMNLLKAFSKDHLVLLVTHEANLVDFYCDKVIELSDGQVAGTRDNSNANGYTARSKNDIYLGEYELNESKNGNVVLEYYGEPAEEIRLRVVNAGGRLYLESLNPNVRFLDNSSETKLVPGKYTETANREMAEQALDLSALTPVETEPTGRLYTLKSSLKSALSSMFSGKKRKLTKFERIALFAMAFTLVFLTASSGRNLKKYFTTKSSCSDNLLFIKTEEQNWLFDATKDNSFLDPSDESKIDFAYVFRATEDFHGIDLSFRQASFSSVESKWVDISTTLYDNKLLSNLQVVAGSKEIKSKSDIVISTKAADELIKSSTYNFVDSYDSLIGMTSGINSMADSDINFCIVGIVKSDDNAVYVDTNEMIKAIYGVFVIAGNTYFDVTPESEAQDILKGRNVEPGTYISYTRIDEAYATPDEDGKTWKYKGDFNRNNAEQPMLSDIIVMGIKMKSADDIIEYTTGQENLYLTIISDEDFSKLARLYGTCAYADDEGNAPYYEYMDRLAPEYILVHTSDVETTKAFLESKGVKNIMAPKDVVNERLDNDLRPFINTAIVMGVITAVMCLTLFFIMRASMLSRIREIGINRAIGVSKKNLCFRFLVESFVLTAFTVFLGYFIASICVELLTTDTLLENFLFYPPVIALALLVIILAASLLAGVLPVVILLRKTPSAILSKYDI